MIYRCRWCERGYCEDCLDFDKTLIIGENLHEYEVLGFQPIAGAFYIKCPDCHDHHVEDPKAEAFCKRKAVEFEREYEDLLEARRIQNEMEEEELKAALAAPSRPDSLTDATTLDDSGVSTPRMDGFDGVTNSGKVKRKAAPTYLGLKSITPEKRSPRHSQNTLPFHQSPRLQSPGSRSFHEVPRSRSII
jgi:hypothetical protein